MEIKKKYLALGAQFFLALALALVIGIATTALIAEAIVFQDDKIPAFSGAETLHWSNMPITYNYSEDCDGELIEKSLAYISEKTGNSITFKKVDKNPDITYVHDANKENSQWYNFSEKVGWAVVSYNKKTGTFYPGEIHFFELEKNSSDNKSNVIIHETLHMLGINHTNVLDLGNVMNPYVIGYYETNISNEDIQYLKTIYGDKALIN